ncbi:SDR family oxidoreductase [Glycomyces halotolerans]
MIMVTGASGALGSLITTGLVEAGAAVVAGTREPSAFAAADVPARRVDFDDPGPLPESFAGIDVLVLVSAGYSEDDVVIARHRAAIRAAEGAGVRHVVYTGLAKAGDHLSIALAHRATERILAASSLECTVLGNGIYAELIADASAEAEQSGVVGLPMGEGKIAVVAREDLAEAAARVAAEGDADPGNPHRGRTYELVGTEAIGGVDLASELARRHGRPIVYRPQGLATFREALCDAGLLQYQIAHSVSIFSNIGAGYLDGTESDLPALLGRAPRRLADVIAALEGGRARFDGSW